MKDRSLKVSELASVVIILSEMILYFAIKLEYEKSGIE